MKKEITIGDKYSPCIKITDEEEAAKYFEECVEHTMSFGYNRLEAIRIEKQNIAYFAGYSDRETRIRVEKMFKCQHPILGKAADYNPTQEEAFLFGVKKAKEMVNEQV